MAMNVKGSIRRILDTRQVSDKFSVREFDIATADDKYPQTLRMQVTNDRIAMLDGLGVGDAVSVDFSLRGREWTGKDGVLKVFNSIDAWRVERTNSAQSATVGAPQRGDAADDGIPF